MNANGSTGDKRGILNLILQVSRIFGIAPVSFTTDGVRVSQALVVFSRVLIIALNIILIAGLAIDVLAGPDRAMRLTLPVNGGVWLANVCIVMVLANDGIYNAPWRIPTLIRMMRSINKIQNEVGDNESNYFTQKKTCVGVASVIVTAIILIILDYQESYCFGVDNQKQIKAMYFYISFYVEYCIVIILEIQFVIIAQMPYLGLRSMNVGLQRLLKKFHRRDATTSHQTCTKLRHLSKYYIDMCSMVREINKSNSITLFCITLLQILDFFKNSSFWIADVAYFHNFALGLANFWCIFNVITTLFMLEPINKTQLEIQQTHNLLRLLIHRIPMDMAVKIELDKFVRHLALNDASYSPMGIFTVSPSYAIATASGMASYIVLIVQLELS